MKNNSKKFTGIIAISAIVATFGVTAITSAHFGGYGLDEEQRDAVEAAIEDGDYGTWKSIQNSIPRITDLITEDNFSEYSEMHNLMQSGDFEEAEVLREELGLPEMGPKGMRDGGGMHGRDGHNQIGYEAIESGDYEAWKEEVGDTRMSEIIQTEEDFQKLVESHELFEAGDFEEANQIKEDLGLEMGMRDGFGKGRMGGKWQGMINSDN
ncbi:hypothetical protein C0584_05380 [Candidatus Parcubacteria bacterium]|nr:MAG: hypothetical protein C0584_05380 [Candidatus Parcubacteria bacterium]